MYTIDDIRKALIPVIGDGEATKRILESFPDNNSTKEIKENHIVVRVGYDTEIFRVIHISSNTGLYKCKSWHGIVTDIKKEDLSLATDRQRMTYYKNQVEFLRTSIAPFLNFFHMRQLYYQLRDEDAKSDMSGQLGEIEQTCFSKLQDIKKLW